MKKILAIILILSCAYGSNAQSIFKPLPNPYKEYYQKLRLTLDTIPTGTVWNGFRLTGPMVVYSYNFSTNTSSVFTGVGGDYEHDALQTNGSYYTTWAVGLAVYEGGQFAPTSLSMVTGVGVHVALFNKYLLLGVLYNITSKSVQPIGGINSNLVPNN